MAADLHSELTVDGSLDRALTALVWFLLFGGVFYGAAKAGQREDRICRGHYAAAHTHTDSLAVVAAFPVCRRTFGPVP